VPIYDLSLPISPSMVVWSGDPPVRVEPRLRIAHGDAVNVSELCLGSHTGTHVDPPYHFVDGGAKVDELPLECLLGPAWVYDLGSGTRIRSKDLQQAVPPGTLRLLLKTSNSALWHSQVQEFREDYVTMEPEAARWIVDQGIRLVGVDYLSVEAPSSPGHPVHHAFLEAGIVIVEGLDLSPLYSGWYNFYCLPLRVAGGDGAPARAVAVGPLQ
jgi:arylformamidase